jgi:hypothetical protein
MQENNPISNEDLTVANSQPLEIVDVELRENILTEFKQVLKLAPADYTESCTNVVMSLIKSRDQQTALAAQIAELYSLITPIWGDKKWDEPDDYVLNLKGHDMLNHIKELETKAIALKQNLEEK